jgi:hypothetical protein
MPEQLPAPAPDEPRGDMGDQASRLQMAEEQAAIAAALAGDVHGSDALDDRSPVIDPLEGPDLIDGHAVDGSDDPVYGGGMPVIDPGEAVLRAPDGSSSDPDLAMTGLAEDGAAMAVDEGGSVSTMTSELVDEDAAEDLDALLDVQDLGHDPDDPQDPDGYGVPPAGANP